MKIALASAPVKNRDVSFNLQAMEAVIDSCKGKAEAIVFGESVLQGFDCLCWEYEKDKAMAVQITDVSIARMRAAAKKAHMAVSFGFIEREGAHLFSSQIFIGSQGEIVNLFRRVSEGWKEFDRTDSHYKEGKGFARFAYGGKRFSVGLCGDLWTEGRPEEMKALQADIVLWPVWCDYNAKEWNTVIKHEYAQQAALCGENVLLINPFSIDKGEEECASGGAAWFQVGSIVQEMPAGCPGYMIAEV